MIWGPFLLALALGLVVSAGLYFAYLWPAVEPEEVPESGSTPEPAAADTSTASTSSEPAATETAPSEESSPA